MAFSLTFTQKLVVYNSGYIGGNFRSLEVIRVTFLITQKCTFDKTETALVNFEYESILGKIEGENIQEAVNSVEEMLKRKGPLSEIFEKNGPEGSKRICYGNGSKHITIHELKEVTWEHFFNNIA